MYKLYTFKYDCIKKNEIASIDIEVAFTIVKTSKTKIVKIESKLNYFDSFSQKFKNSYQNIKIFIKIAAN